MADTAERAEAAAPTGSRVSTLELFFDLVFVFTVTQLTAVLAGHPTWDALLHVVLVLGLIWWMYGGYAWLTNAVAPDRAGRRVLLLGGMGAFLVLALAIPEAFSGAGLAFGLAYAAVVAVHTGLFTRAASQSVLRSLVRLAPFNLLSTALVLAGGIAGGTALTVLWAAAFVNEWIVTPRLADNEGFEIEPGHFAERHGLVVIVAIGESVVAIGIGAAGLPVDLSLVCVALLGLGLSTCLWWAYFGNGDDERAEHALASTPARERPRVALEGYGYWHLLLLLGVIALAAGTKKAVGHPFDPLSDGAALALAGGVATFVAGDVLFRRTVGLGRTAWRAGAAVLALATFPLGAGLAAAAQLAAIVAVLAAAFALERGRT